jgi:hypothetical protein
MNLIQLKIKEQENWGTILDLPFPCFKQINAPNMTLVVSPQFNSRTHDKDTHIYQTLIYFILMYSIISSLKPQMNERTNSIFRSSHHFLRTLGCNSSH